MDFVTSLIGKMPTLLAAASGGSDGSIFEKFGVNWPKFLAQVLLFLIVYMILSKFAFKPILAILEERKQRIADSEENLKRIAAELEEADLKKGEIISEANARAERLVSEARESADALAEKKRNEATAEAAQIIAKAREAGELEKNQAMAELKRDFGRLVVDTTGKVTGKVLTDDDQQKINSEISAQISV
ncbi:MAG: F0F1 ATP synthase subunit B [Verrucomicrobiota bacterium]|nr:F0F1 ATP synthase subunit B [Verrucomicrobiota bacterium]